MARKLGAEVFLKVAFDHPFEWFNDTAWAQIEHNFRQYAYPVDSGLAMNFKGTRHFQSVPLIYT